jgi:DNA-binding MarR family transcriptional regulator
MQPFRDASKTPVSATDVAAFCAVAARPGKTISDYARTLNISRNSMSRAMMDFSDTARGGGPGMGLIDQRVDIHDRRQVTCGLTPRGREFARKIAAAILPVRPANPARDAAEALFGGSKAKVG